MLDSWLSALKVALWGAVWGANLAAASRFERTSVNAIRILVTVSRDLADGQLGLRAMSLVYTTLLSLVPLLAVSFSVLKGFGVHNQLEGLLLSVLEPLGDEGVRVTSEIVGFVENMDVRVLGSTGLAVLIYTVISMVQKIDAAVNRTWRIRQGRSFFDRFSRYLSVILIGPVLMVAAVGISASLMSTAVVQEIIAVEPFGALYRFVVGLVPYVLVTAAFTFVYIYIPNTRVRVAAALSGGLVAGILWVAAGSAFAAFVVGSTSKYTAIYSSFAILIVFMIWLYIVWLVVLIGAAVAFYTQHPEYLGVRRTNAQIGAAIKERVGLQLMRLIARGFVGSEPPIALPNIARELNLPLENIREVVASLEMQGLLCRLQGDVEAYVPARDLQAIEVVDILRALRASDGDTQLLDTQMHADSTVDSLIGRMDDAIGRVCDARTLRELAFMDKEGAAPARGPKVVETEKNDVPGA